MDPVTQGLIGAVTAELGFRQRLGKGATLAAAAAAMLPDADVFLSRPMRWWKSAGGDDTWAFVHRGPSHSLILVPVIALVFTVGWWYFRKWSPRKRYRLAAGKPVAFDPDRPPGSFGLMFAATVVAVATHGLLDLCTTWGTQYFWPFSTERFAIDLLPIVDIFYTPILLITVLACWLVRKLRPTAARAALAIGWIGFALSMGYVGAAAVLRSAAIDRASATAAEASGRPAEALSYRAYPQLGTVLMWRVTARADDLWMAARVNFITDGDAPVVWQTVAAQDNHWIRLAGNHPRARTFKWFAQGFIRADHHPNSEGHTVAFYDMRYGQSPDAVRSLWSLRVDMDEAGNIISTRRTHPGDGNSKIDRRKMIRRYWRELWHANGSTAQ